MAAHLSEMRHVYRLAPPLSILACVMRGMGEAGKLDDALVSCLVLLASIACAGHKHDYCFLQDLFDYACRKYRAPLDAVAMEALQGCHRAQFVLVAYSTLFHLFKLWWCCSFSSQMARARMIWRRLCTSPSLWTNQLPSHLSSASSSSPSSSSPSFVLPSSAAYHPLPVAQPTFTHYVCSMLYHQLIIPALNLLFHLRKLYRSFPLDPASLTPASLTVSSSLSDASVSSSSASSSSSSSSASAPAREHSQPLPNSRAFYRPSLRMGERVCYMLEKVLTQTVCLPFRSCIFAAISLVVAVCCLCVCFFLLNYGCFLHAVRG